MAVTIRLKRCGKNNRPYFHIVAADSRKKRDGNFIEKLGHYDPLENPSKIFFKEDRIRYWFGKGAYLSTAVSAMMRKHKITLERLKTHVAKKRPAKEAE